MAKGNDSSGQLLSFSFQKVFYTLASLFGLLFLLYLGRTVLVPLAFSFLIAFILYPVCVWMERKGISRAWSILLTMLGVTLILSGITVLFSAQIIDIIKELDDFSQRLNDVLLAVTDFINKKVSFVPDVDRDSLIDMGLKWFSNKSGGMLSNTLNKSALFITGLTLTIIYSFLLLLYRSGFKKAFISFVDKDKQSVMDDMITNVQKVGQQYLTGMFTLILILGCLNSLGLFLIGIDYALFFGFLAGFLVIIPYIGTSLGGALPALYAFLNYDSLWYPFAVILVFWFIQLIEGNFLNPKIVGGNLNVNALAAILALITGGLIWGIPGMILFLPFTAIAKVICERYDQLRPVSLLLKDDNTSGRGSFKGKIEKIFKKK